MDERGGGGGAILLREMVGEHGFGYDKAMFLKWEFWGAKHTHNGGATKATRRLATSWFRAFFPFFLSCVLLGWTGSIAKTTW